MADTRRDIRMLANSLDGITVNQQQLAESAAPVQTIETAAEPEYSQSNQRTGCCPCIPVVFNRCADRVAMARIHIRSAVLAFHIVLLDAGSLRRHSSSSTAGEEGAAA